VVDIAKLDAALAYIEEHPKEWEQTTYGRKTACGTAGCVAFHGSEGDLGAVEAADAANPGISGDELFDLREDCA